MFFIRFRYAKHMVPYTDLPVRVLRAQVYMVKGLYRTSIGRVTKKLNLYRYRVSVHKEGKIQNCPKHEASLEMINSCLIRYSSVMKHGFNSTVVMGKSKIFSNRYFSKNINIIDIMFVYRHAVKTPKVKHTSFSWGI